MSVLLNVCLFFAEEMLLAEQGILGCCFFLSRTVNNFVLRPSDNIAGGSGAVAVTGSHTDAHISRDENGQSDERRSVENISG